MLLVNTALTKWAILASLCTREEEDDLAALATRYLYSPRHATLNRLSDSFFRGVHRAPTFSLKCREKVNLQAKRM